MVGAAARSGCSSNEGSRVGAETVDAAVVDAVTVGAAALDAAMVDVAAVDAAIVDAAAVDVAAVNAATVDATTVGAATVNAATVDATMVDVATVDAAAVAAAEDRRQRRMQRIIIWSKTAFIFRRRGKALTAEVADVEQLQWVFESAWQVGCQWTGLVIKLSQLRRVGCFLVIRCKLI